MTYISIFQLLSLICVGLLFGGVLNLLLGDRTNNCEMTYMYEYPQFVRIKVTGNDRFPQYGLYSYSEGRLTERARKMRFDGIPVLFLPGNSGSHHQVRSLASVALRKALSSQLDLHFDYFTVDFNEEISGLYGGVLDTQTEFALMSLKTVLELYNNRQNTKPQSVILIGHSIGGVIAKGIAINEAASNMTKLIITIASPTMIPVVNIDSLINKYYMKLNSNWQTKQEMKNKVLVNIGSGYRDILVPSGLTLSSDSDVHALTTAIPGVWISNDHLSITWCRQLILVINRFLFSIVDRTTEQISDDKQYILNQAQTYFKENNSLTVNTAELPEEPIHFDAFWYEDSRRIYQISRPQITKLTYLMIRLINFPQNRFVAIKATNLEDKIWVYGCNAAYTYSSQRVCKTAAPLSELSKWVPAPKGSPKAKIALIHLHNIMEQRSNWTHVIVKISPTREPVQLDIDTNDKASRTITVPAPAFCNFGKTIVKSETEANTMYYELVIPGFEMLYQTLLLYVEPMNKCSASSKIHVTAEMHVPWASGHEVYYMFTPADPGPMRLRLFKSKPIASRNSSGDYVSVMLLLDTQCTYRISISNSHYDTLGQLTRNYATLIVPYLVAVLLLMARQNLMDLSAEEDARCKSFHSVLCSDSLKPYYILVTGRLGNVVFASIPLFGYIFANAGSHVGTVYTTGGTLLPLPIYLTALGFAQIAGAAVIGSIVCASQVAHRLVLRVIWRGRGGNLAEKATSALRRVPSVVAVLLVAIVPTSCGAAALAVGGAFYFFMLSKMYEEYLEDFVYKILAKVLYKIKTYFKPHTKNNTQNQSKDLTVSTVTPVDTVKSFVDTVKKNCDTSQKVKTEKNGSEVPAIKDKSEDSETLPLLANEEKSLNESCENGKNLSESGKKGKEIVDKPKEDNKNDDDSTLVKCDNSIEETSANKMEELPEAGSSEASTMTPTVNANIIEVKDESDDQLSGLNFHFFMFCLWALVTFINLPALLTWARNFKYGMVLQSDVSLYPGVVLSISAGFLWQIEAPRKRLKHYEVMSQIIFIMAVLTLMLAPSAMFYLNYIIPTVFALITFQQFLDKEITLPSSNIINNEDSGREETQIPETRPPEDTEDSNVDSFKEFKEKFDKFTAED